MNIGIFDRFDTFIDESRNDYGGSQTWMLEVSKAFSNMGYTVHMFCNTRMHKYKNIVFIPKDKFEEVIQYATYDKFIFCRGCYKIDKIQSPDVSLMMHDETMFNLDNSNIDKLSHIYFLSQYAMDVFTKTYGNNFISKYKLTCNGIDYSLYETKCQKENMMVWSSCVERGYSFFIHKVLPLILDEVSDFKVNVCQYKDKSIELGRNTTYIGKCNKKELANLQLKAKIWCYPNLGYLTQPFQYGKSFNETFCITALENAAAGAHIVCGANGGLLTTISNDKLVCREFFEHNKVINEDEYAKQLAHFAILCLQDKLDLRYDDHHKYTWDNAAKSLL